MSAHNPLPYAALAFVAGVSLGAKLLGIEDPFLATLQDMVILSAYASLCRR